MVGLNLTVMVHWPAFWSHVEVLWASCDCMQITLCSTWKTWHATICLLPSSSVFCSVHTNQSFTFRQLQPPPVGWSKSFVMEGQNWWYSDLWETNPETHHIPFESFCTTKCSHMWFGAIKVHNLKLIFF